MKVLFVSSANRGSIGPIVKAQGESLRRLGIAVDYFGIQGKGIRGYLSNIFPLCAHIRKTSPDLVHAHYSLCGIVAALTFAANPLVVSLMGSDTKTGRIFKLVVRLFSRYVWDRVIVKSESMKTDMGLDQAVVIPNGVDCSFFRPMAAETLKRRFAFPDNRKVALFLADPARESKNFNLAEKAFREPCLSTASELVVRYGLPREEIPEILNAADLVLLTSRWEGSPNVVKEAMACNCPVVATDVGDIAWLLEDELGHFITSFKPEDVARKIKLALEFSESVGKTKGRERIIKLGLDSETIAKRIVDVYRAVLQQ